MPLTPVQLETRIQELLEGTLPEAHWPALRERLMTSEQARELYCHYARMTTLLRQRSRGIKSLAAPTPAVPVEELLRVQRRKASRVAVFAAAAVLVIALMAMRLFFVQEPQPALTFASAPGTQFTLTHDGSEDAPVGLVLEKGSRLEISQGAIELRFGSGVRSVVQAPADVTLHDDDTLFMREGIAWFHVPANATGFQVKTHDLEIVDLGTEFGVISNPNDHDEVHVFKGRVQVAATRLRMETATLGAGQGRRIDPIGRLDSVPIHASAFLTRLPAFLPHLHWSFDGKGKDIYLVSGNLPTKDGILSKAVALDRHDPFASVPGKFGTALCSTGRGGFMTTDWPGIEGNAPRTIAYWLKLPPGKQYLHPVVGWGARSDVSRSATGEFLSIVETSATGAVVNLSIGAYELHGTTPVDDGRWHHVAHVFTGGSNSDGTPEIYSYIDGELEQTRPEINASAPRNADGNISVNTSTDGINSVPLRVFNHLWAKKREAYSITPSIDELYVFQGALSRRQIRNIYLKNEVNP
ncbi:MAG: FecR domain-containing protein [Akkermansiaceae bacterium]|nr:FecR domain-containing protein [Akkermansiaceae bacterium]